MAPIVITEAEILQALTVAASGPDDARTVHELSAATGVSEPRIRRALKTIQAEGRLQMHIVRRPDLSGRMQPIPAYLIDPKAPAKRKR